MNSSQIVLFIQAVVVAVLGGLFVFLNAEWQKARKKDDLYRLMRAEITNLDRHCRKASEGLRRPSHDMVAHVKTAKYKDGSLLLFDAREAYLLKHIICQDVMQLSLLSRNSDIFAESLVEYLAEHDADDEVVQSRLESLATRLEGVGGLCRKVLKAMETPKDYNDTVINW